MNIRRLLPALLLFLLLFSFTQPALAQSGGDYDLDWWTVDGGGGESAGGGFSLSGSAGQPDAGALSGSDFELTGGFWHGPLAGKPKAVADLTITKDSGKAKLTWSAVTEDIGGNAISGVTYDVYRAIGDPYFTPGAPYATDVTDTFFLDPDTNVLTDSASNAFYIVTAVNAGLESEDSRRVGTFVFDLVPGSS